MEEKAAELVVEMEGGAKEEGRVAAKAPAAQKVESVETEVELYHRGRHPTRRKRLKPM